MKKTGLLLMSVVFMFLCAHKNIFSINLQNLNKKLENKKKEARQILDEDIHKMNEENFISWEKRLNKKINEIKNISPSEIKHFIDQKSVKIKKRKNNPFAGGDSDDFKINKNPFKNPFAGGHSGINENLPLQNLSDDDKLNDFDNTFVYKDIDGVKYYLDSSDNYLYYMDNNERIKTNYFFDDLTRLKSYYYLHYMDDNNKTFDFNDDLFIKKDGSQMIFWYKDTDQPSKTYNVINNFSLIKDIPKYLKLFFQSQGIKEIPNIGIEEDIVIEDTVFQVVDKNLKPLYIDKDGVNYYTDKGYLDQNKKFVVDNKSELSILYYFKNNKKSSKNKILTQYYIDQDDDLYSIKNNIDNYYYITVDGEMMEWDPEKAFFFKMDTNPSLIDGSFEEKIESKIKKEKKILKRNN